MKPDSRRTRQLMRLYGFTSTCQFIVFLIKDGEIVQAVPDTGSLTNSTGTVTHHLLSFADVPSYTDSAQG